MGYLVMVILLLVIGYCGLQFMFIETQAKTSFHQIYASVYLVAALIAFVGAAMGGLIQNAIGKLQELKRPAKLEEPAEVETVDLVEEAT